MPGSCTLIVNNLVPHTITESDYGKYILASLTASEGGESVTQVVSTYIPAPTLALTAVSPATGSVAGGTTITLTGTGFYSGMTVSIDSVSCGSVNVVSATSLTCTTGAKASGTYAVSIANTAGQIATLPSAFTYEAPENNGGGGGFGGGGFGGSGFGDGGSNEVVIEIPQTKSDPVIITQPEVLPTPDQTPKTPERKITVTKTSTKTVINIAPKVPIQQPLISVGTSNIAIKGVTQGQRIRVTVVGKNGLAQVLTPKSDKELSALINKNAKATVKIEITPTSTPTLKKKAKIAIDGAKKNQRVRVTVNK